MRGKADAHKKTVIKAYVLSFSLSFIQIDSHSFFIVNDYTISEGNFEEIDHKKSERVCR